MDDAHARFTGAHLPSNDNLNFPSIAPNQALRISLTDRVYEFMPFRSEARWRLLGLFPTSKATDFPAFQSHNIPQKGQPFSGLVNEMTTAIRLWKKVYSKNTFLPAS